MPYGLAQSPIIFISIHFRHAKLVEVRRPVLDVEQMEIALAETGYEGGEGDLGHVADAVEFGFGEEGTAEVDAVSAAGELAIDPDFDRVGVAFAV